MAKVVRTTIALDPDLAAEVELYRTKGLNVSEVCRAALRAEVDRLKAIDELASKAYSAGVQAVETVPRDVFVMQVEPVSIVSTQDILSRLTDEARALYEQLSDEERARIEEAGRGGTIDAFRVRRASMSSF